MTFANPKQIDQPKQFGQAKVPLGQTNQRLARLDNLQVEPPLTLKNYPTGMVLGCAPITNTAFNFCTLTTEVAGQSYGKARPWRQNVTTSTGWEFDYSAEDIDVYASPLMAQNQWYVVGTICMIAFFSMYQRWVIVSSSCLGCS